jgi:hypothetical protein
VLGLERAAVDGVDQPDVRAREIERQRSVVRALGVGLEADEAGRLERSRALEQNGLATSPSTTSRQRSRSRAALDGERSPTTGNLRVSAWPGGRRGGSGAEVIATRLRCLRARAEPWGHDALSCSTLSGSGSKAT